MRRTDSPAETKRGSILGRPDTAWLGPGEPRLRANMVLALPAGRHAGALALLVRSDARRDLSRDCHPTVSDRQPHRRARRRAQGQVPRSDSACGTRHGCPIEEAGCSQASFRIAASFNSTAKITCRSRTSRRGRQLVAEVRRFLAEPSSAVVAGGKTLPLGELTPRERAVLEAIAEGLDNAEIARSLRLSEKTVRNHITRIFDKIRVKHRYQAIVLAREAGLGGAASPPVGAEAGHLSRTPGAAPTPRRDISLNTTAFAPPTISARRASARRHASHGEAQSRETSGRVSFKAA